MSEESILNKDILFFRDEIKAYLLFELNFAEVLCFIVISEIKTLIFLQINSVVNHQCLNRL